MSTGDQVQDKKDLNLFAGQGVALREVVMKPGHGRVDYLLYVDRAVVGVIEAKPVGTRCPGSWQSAMYLADPKGYGSGRLTATANVEDFVSP